MRCRKIVARPFQRDQRGRPPWRHRRRKTRRRRQLHLRRSCRPQPNRLAGLACAYATALAVCIGTVGTLVESGPATGLTVAGAVYIGCGFTLTRLFNHRLGWLRWKASVAVVGRVKIRAIASWPISVPVFIAQLCIAKHF